MFNSIKKWNNQNIHENGWNYSEKKWTTTICSCPEMRIEIWEHFLSCSPDASSVWAHGYSQKDKIVK